MNARELIDSLEGYIKCPDVDESDEVMIQVTAQDGINLTWATSVISVGTDGCGGFYLTPHEKLVASGGCNAS